MSDIQDKQSKIRSANEEIQNQRRVIENKNLNLEEAYKKLDGFQVEMDKLRKEIDKLKKDIKALEKSISENEKKKDDLLNKLNHKIEIFKKRIDVMYKNRNTGYVPMLLSSNDVDDFLSRLTTMKSVAQYDTDLIKEMKETKKEYELTLVQLKGQKTSLDEAMKNYNYKEAELMDTIADQKDLISVIQHELKLSLEEKNKLEKRVVELDSEISSLSQKLKERLEREEAERQRLAEEERKRIEAEKRAREQAAQTQSSLLNETNELSNVSVNLRNLLPDGEFKPFDGNVVYYSQREEPWASTRYGNGIYGTIAANGCGPTSMAMVLSSMTNAVVTPADMANYSTLGGHVMPGDGGSFWSLFPAAASEYGLSCRQTTNQNEIVQALASGSMVIASQTNALGNYWTIGGHFIVLSGITPDGQIKVADPWSRAKSAITHSQTQVFVPMRAAWIISK